MHTAIANARLRPGMFGLDGSFSEYVAFLVGMDTAMEGSLLGDFSEWLATRSGKGGRNLFWPVLVLLETELSDLHRENWHNLEGEEGSHAVSTLFELLNEFLEDEQRQPEDS
ncbi:hypothetical protein [Streptomyces sp. NPDC051183]|uniref:hypothetical protein n=1 Tax=unclassified Streptomyces TaxID=2593676 RepID=UPI00342F15BB